MVEAAERSTGESGQQIKFAGDLGFHGEVKRRVDAYFEGAGLNRRDRGRMYLKTATILTWFGVSYGLLVFAATSWWQAVLCSVSLALAVAGIGFSIQHDGNHEAYSNRGWVNRLMGMTLDLMGGSSYVWRWKHGVFHHTYPNLTGADDDIDVGPFARLAPAQRRYGLHRFQQYYLWALYGALGIKWHFVDDFKNVTEGRIAHNRFPRPKGWDLVELVGGKLVFLTWALGVPLLFHRWWAVLAFYALTTFVVSVTLAVVFQLAHCVEEADFPPVAVGGEQMANAWAVHQVLSTVDFARKSRFLTWYLGGLNFQIEHHLFPKICHVHYPQISPIVERTCAEYGVRYMAHDGLFGAMSSHWRWLKRMGQPATAV